MSSTLPVFLPQTEAGYQSCVPVVSQDTPKQALSLACRCSPVESSSTGPRAGCQQPPCAERPGNIPAGDAGSRAEPVEPPDEQR